jgi:hypothetical protein
MWRLPLHRNLSGLNPNMSSKLRGKSVGIFKTHMRTATLCRCLGYTIASATARDTLSTTPSELWFYLFMFIKKYYVDANAISLTN